MFGKLLEWEQTSSDSNEGAIAEGAVGDDSDLREHVVGILFAGHKLTSLQRQVYSFHLHIEILILVIVGKNQVF